MSAFAQERAGPVKKADIQTYIDKAKGGKLSAILRNHIFGDAVTITRGAEVSGWLPHPAVAIRNAVKTAWHRGWLLAGWQSTIFR